MEAVSDSKHRLLRVFVLAVMLTWDFEISFLPSNPLDANWLTILMLIGEIPACSCVAWQQTWCWKADRNAQLTYSRTNQLWVLLIFLCSLRCSRLAPQCRWTAVASVVRPAGMKWCWTATASMVFSGTCLWKTSLTYTNRKSATPMPQGEERNLFDSLEPLFILQKYKEMSF